MLQGHTFVGIDRPVVLEDELGPILILEVDLAPDFSLLYPPSVL